MARKKESASLEDLLQDGWGYHDKESERLAIELETAAQEELPPALLARFLDLSIHTIGEHLGDWQRALKLGQKVISGQIPALETARAWARLHVAAILAGDYLEAADFEFSYVQAAGQGFDAALDLRFILAEVLVCSNRLREGARLYRRALDLVDQLSHTAFLDRTIAVASNNIGWELYELSSRTPEDDRLMQLAAETSLKFWLKCGNWINAERAHYLNALVANVTGNPGLGLEHADAALAIIVANGDRPLDEAQLHLARAAAYGALGDADGRASAIRDADTTAAKLRPNLKAQFAAERDKVAAASSEPV